MTKDGKVRVAIVGLGFGAEFVPIYQRHPNAEMYAICRRDRVALDECGDRFGGKVRYTDYQQLLADANVDAFHINAPIADHAPQAIAALGRTPGLRVHRSCWVAEKAVVGMRADGRNLRLSLANGLTAPVARSCVGAVREAGWLARGDEAVLAGQQA